MTNPALILQAETYLKTLCLTVPTRRMGTPGNRAASQYLAEAFASFGFQVERQPFECIDWTHGAALLRLNSEQFQVHVGPFSPGCWIEAPLSVVSSLEELEPADVRDRILLLRGEIANQQLMPRNFPFYNPEEHQRIFALLESKQPRAVLTASGRNPEMAGALYPFPMIEDGDFDLPSAYMTEEAGARLASHAGERLALAIEAERRPSSGFNLVARKGRSERRLVFSAHIDAKDGTPGALDNAAGVVVLLLLAELLQGYQGETGIELVPFNGEDHYSAAGEIAYLQANQGRLDQVLLNVNMDGLGARGGKTAYSLYQCPDELTSTIQSIFAENTEFVEGPAWFQGDHMVFVMNSVPALALTSENFMQILTEIAHTPKDSPDLVDCEKLVRIAGALQRLATGLA